MQLTLFNPPPKPPPEKQTRREFTSGDIRETEKHYTHGGLTGKQMAKRLGRTYESFKRFVARNQLYKREKGHR